MSSNKDHQDFLSKSYILVNLKNDVIDLSKYFNISKDDCCQIEDLKLLLPEDADIVIPTEIIKNKKDIYLYSLCFLEKVLPVENRECYLSEDIEYRLNKFISKAKPIGWPFTNSDAELYAIDNDLDVILKLTI